MRRAALLAVGIAATVALAPTIPAAAGTVATGQPADCRPTDSNSSTIALTIDDNERTFCLLRGQRLSVFLRVDPQQWPNRRNWWTHPRASGNALTDTTVPAPVALGVTWATFAASAPGQSVLMSFRDICPPPPPNCGAPLFTWRVTANVTE